MPFGRVLLVKPLGRVGLGFLVDEIPIGLEFIAAYIEDAVNDVNIVDMEMERKSFQNLIDQYHPDLVGITMTATTHNEGLRLSKIAKNNGITTMVGGYHPTSIPELLLSHPQLDMVVRGEGELTVREIVEKGCPENVLGISYKKDGRIIHNKDRQLLNDLDRLPFPARHLRKYTYKANDRKTDFDVLVTSRGCYGQCTFCCEPIMNHSYLRCRSPENVVKEVLEIARYHEMRPVNVFIADPMFMGHPERVGLLCDLLQEHDLDMKFNALVRADNMARNPEIVKKMCKAGIDHFEMGIESPNPIELKSTKKGITNRIQKRAVRNIRKYGGCAGGTFIIGLLDHTEEEIRKFPIYAKEIGLTSAAFGIATPFPGTEFYKELDSEGLIFEDNWDNFDLMHSVYKTKYLSKKKIEELATYCMAKFWSIDTFIDREKVFQRRTKKKTPLVNFILERVIELNFMTDAGLSLKKDKFGYHLMSFLKYYSDPCVESYTRKVGIHNILELSRILRIIGSQTIQCTLRCNSYTMSIIIGTTKNKVKYMRVIPERQNYSTINFDIDLNLMSYLDQKLNTKMIKNLIAMILKDGNTRRIWNTLRLFLAIGTEVLLWKLTTNTKQ
jgi:radical SAM superfamily enzyme YgiQ (UPF0313 family)